MLANLFVSLALVLGLHTRPPQETPRQVVLETIRAFEQGSLEAVRVRWDTRLAADSTDRAAILALATLARFGYDYERAETLYAKLFTKPDAQPDGYAVWARLGYADGRQWRGQLPRAQEALELATLEAVAAGDSLAWARAMIRLSVVESRTRGRAAAQARLSELDGLVPEDDLRLQAMYRCTRASLLGPASEAEVGAELAVKAGDRRAFAGCLHLLAQNQIRVGNTDSALHLLGRADEEQAAARDRVGRAATLQWTGYLLNTVGAYGQARQQLHQALAEGEASGNLSPVAWGYLNLATIALNSRNVPAASGYVERATAMMEEQGDRWGYPAAQTMQADIAAAAGRRAEARALYHDALPLLEKNGSGPQIVGAHVALYDMAMADEDLVEAEKELTVAREFARVRGMRGWERGLDFAFAELSLAKGDLDSAERYLYRVLEIRGSPVRRYRAMVRRAELHARRGSLDQAEADLREANNSLDRWRNQLNRDGLRRYAFQVHEYRYDPDLSFATVLSQLAVQGRAEAAFQLAEQQRGRDLLDQLVRAGALSEAPGVEATAAAETITSAGIDAATVAAALPDDSTALLEFVSGLRNEPTTLFVITKAGLKSYRLPSVDSLADDVELFLVLASSGTDAVELSRRLTDALLAPALAELPGQVRRLIIVADGILHWLPFDALRLADQLFLAERFAVSLSPSAAVAIELWGRERPESRSTLLALADPRYEIEAGVVDGPAADLRAAFAEYGGLPRLPGSRREARAAARFVELAEVRLRAEASEAYLKQADLQGFEILHFATHALVDDHSLARTALALAPGDGQDGFVAPGDLAALRLGADLVVLSGCRTASGVVVRGEGVYGLTVPLLEAGAQSVLATGWRINDREAARFTESIYRHLASGQAVGDALQAAKIEALRRRAPVAEWAAFTLVGDPLVRLQLQEPRSWPVPPLVAIGGVGLLAALLVLIVRFLRRKQRAAELAA